MPADSASLRSEKSNHELTVLAAFAAGADDRSFAKAAIDLGVSRSAISHSIRTLDEHLRLRLLARTARSVAPMDAGERLPRSMRSLNTVCPARRQVAKSWELK